MVLKSEFEIIDEQKNNMIMDAEKLAKIKKYKILNKYAIKGQTLFVGSSLMEFFPINELQQALDNRYVIYNRGIAGFVTSELLCAMEECIFELEPSKLFINIGTNDIASFDGEYSIEKLLKNYDKILTLIQTKLPKCKVYVMAYYPINGVAEFDGISKEDREQMFVSRNNENIQKANIEVEKLAKKHYFEFINVNEGLFDEDGNLREEFSMDGIHMYANGYAVVLENLKKYL